MRSLSTLTSAEARCLSGVLFDLDDTVLTHGLLTRTAYGAMWALHDAGLHLVGVTGRPSGWGEVLARQWPLRGCVTENGAVHWVREGRATTLRDVCSASERQSRRARLEELVVRVGALVPEARLADDNTARRSDVAWDIAERGKLEPDRVRAIVGAIRDAGARSLQSSIHLHATFDADDKASGALRFCAREFGEDSTAALTRFAFVGDSGNDAACFGAFRTTFGVANVRSSLASFSVPPRYVARSAMGDGFAEIASEILKKKMSNIGESHDA